MPACDARRAVGDDHRTLGRDQELAVSRSASRSACGGAVGT